MVLNYIFPYSFTYSIISSIMEFSRTLKNLAHGSWSKTIQATHTLKRVNGSHAGEVIPLTSDEIKIGRNPKSEITISDPNVSRNHCVLKYVKNSWILIDLGGVNGTYADGKRINPNSDYPLKDGEGISLGPPAESPAIFLFQSKKDDVHDLDVCRPSSSSHASTSISKEDCKCSTKRRSDSDNTSTPPSLSSAFSSSFKLENPSKLRKTSKSDDDVSNCSISSTDSLKTRIRKKNSLSQKKRTSAKKEKQKENLSQSESESLLSACQEVLKPGSSFTPPIDFKDISKEEAMSKLKLMHDKLSALHSETQKLALVVQELETKELVLSSTTDALKKFIEEELTCTICAELFIKPLTLNCSHTFCESCVDGWKKRKKQCPICREKIVHETKSLVLENFISKAVEQFDEESKNKRKAVTEEREKLKAKQPKKRASAASRRRVHLGSRRGVPASPRPEIAMAEAEARSPLLYYLGSLLRAQDPDSDSDSSSSDEELGSMGYARCFNCGRNGHWAESCPY